MTGRIAIMTDSTCDIPPEWVEEFDIAIIPLTIVWGDEQFLDGVDLSAEAFYEHLAQDTVIPTTSQPTPKLFIDAFQRAAEKGYDEILLLAISSAMSGTIQSARQAAEQSPIPVHIHDSRNNSMGLGWQVIAAAREREAGGTLEAMISAAETVRERVVYYISLDTMTYLVHGGRIGDAVQWVDSMLKIKPLINVKPETGTVGVSIPARSRKAGIQGLYKQFLRKINLDGPLHITVLHNAALEEAQALAKQIQEELNPKEIFINIVSPILGVHTGPRAIAICGYSEA
ncbi:MAG: DegV family protein [Anaerolineaceae bacterium]|nr:DegV family protein [Anaerolineaceae bacterium]